MIDKITILKQELDAVRKQRSKTATGGPALNGPFVTGYILSRLEKYEEYLRELINNEQNK